MGGTRTMAIWLTDMARPRANPVRPGGAASATWATHGPYHPNPKKPSQTSTEQATAGERPRGVISTAIPAMTATMQRATVAYRPAPLRSLIAARPTRRSLKAARPTLRSLQAARPTRLPRRPTAARLAPLLTVLGGHRAASDGARHAPARPVCRGRMRHRLRRHLPHRTAALLFPAVRHPRRGAPAPGARHPVSPHRPTRPTRRRVGARFRPLHQLPSIHDAFRHPCETFARHAPLRRSPRQDREGRPGSRRGRPPPVVREELWHLVPNPHRPGSGGPAPLRRPNNCSSAGGCVDRGAGPHTRARG